MTLSAGFSPNPANFFSCEESCRGQPDFLRERRLLAIRHHARIMLKVIIITWSEFVIWHGWGALSQLNGEAAEDMRGVN